ncbi:MAG: pyridoxal-dependent decarboxylase [Vicinamibacterales bacterium]
MDVADLCRAMRRRLRRRAPRSRRCSIRSSTSTSAVLHRPGAGYFAYIPGGGVFPAALADFIANTTNRYTGIWQAAPALVQLEKANALDWLRGWMGFPDGARPVRTGGSMASFNAILCARAAPRSEIRQGVLYTSDQAHHCVLKAAKLAGIMLNRVRAIPCDEAYRLPMAPPGCGDRRGPCRRPAAVLCRVHRGHDQHRRRGSAGGHRGSLCGEQMWHHVDGAYGAFFHMCEDGPALLPGLSGADSPARSAQGHVPALRHRRAPRA